MLDIVNSFFGEVKTMIRTFFISTFLFLFILFILFLMFAAGWIRIVVDAKKIRQDFHPVKLSSQLETSEIKYANSVLLERNEYQIIHHRVQEGDTVFSLAKQYNVPVERILIYNHLSSPADLYIGQILKIPAQIAAG